MVSKPSLGNTTVFASAEATQDAQKATRIAYKMQQAARPMLPKKHRIGVCHRVSGVPDGSVRIVQHATTKKLRYGGLMTCGMPWVCPICSARISTRRRIELAFKIAKLMAAGYQVAMVTYTLRHTHTDALFALLKILQESYRATKSGRRYQNLKADYEILGSIRTLEITIGNGGKDGGWHPHFHELVFYKTGDAHEMGATIYELYADAVRKRGGDLDRQHGLTVVTADYAVLSDYIAKWGHMPLAEWGLPHEMAQTTKGGRGKGRRSMWKLLYDCAFKAKYADVTLWKEYAQVTHGLKQMYTTPALNEFVGVEDVADEVAAYDADTQTDESVLFTLSSSLWAEVCRLELRAAVLGMAAEADGSLVAFRRRIMAQVRGTVAHYDLSGDGLAVSFSSGVS